MTCPVCDLPLSMAERSGIEIDYCSKCRGVWLDRGELDKIIERSQGDVLLQAERHVSPEYKHDNRYYKKKKNLLGELFDF